MKMWSVSLWLLLEMIKGSSGICYSTLVSDKRLFPYRCVRWRIVRTIVRLIRRLKAVDSFGKRGIMGEIAAVILFRVQLVWIMSESIQNFCIQTPPTISGLWEICNGATYVHIDMLKNERDGSRMLLIEDDGGGMCPDKMRRCMSLGYSSKRNMPNTIGQYGNGFKTSTMRLGADVLVFSRWKGSDQRGPTQSIGMLSKLLPFKVNGDNLN